jgi:hypothetical protein
LSNQEVDQELRDMAKLTLLNNRISSVQVSNLKMYALVYFDGVTSARIEYDVSTKRDVEVELEAAEQNAKYTLNMPKNSNSKIIYDLEIAEGTENSNLQYRCEVLEKSVRSLFWDDISVQILINGESTYRSNQNV